MLADSSFDAAFTGTDVIRQAKAFYPTFNATLCRTLLTRFSLPEDKPMSDFSTGMTAKFKTIIAMSHEPDVLILDEPTSLPEDKPMSDFSTGMTAKFKTIIAMSHEPDVLILDEPTAGLDVVARNELLDLLRAYMETPGRAILISSHNSKDIETLVLILDEPTAGLDVVARNELLDLLRAYMETPGRAILISSHNSKDIETLCDDFYVIDRGRIRLHETIDRLRDDYAVLMLTDDQVTQFEGHRDLVRRLLRH